MFQLHSRSPWSALQPVLIDCRLLDRRLADDPDRLRLASRTSAMTQHSSSEASTSYGGEDAAEVKSPTDMHGECPRLTDEQLQLPTSELYEAKHLTPGKPKNDASNFTGKYAHVCLGSNALWAKWHGSADAASGNASAANAVGLFISQSAYETTSSTARLAHRLGHITKNRRMQSLQEPFESSDCALYRGRYGKWQRTYAAACIEEWLCVTPGGLHMVS